jgi:hypothetical protein
MCEIVAASAVSSTSTGDRPRRRRYRLIQMRGCRLTTRSGATVHAAVARHGRGPCGRREGDALRPDCDCPSRQWRCRAACPEHARHFAQKRSGHGCFDQAASVLASVTASFMPVNESQSIIDGLDPQIYVAGISRRPPASS